jgi:autotransporter family porin
MRRRKIKKSKSSKIKKMILPGTFVGVMLTSTVVNAQTPVGPSPPTITTTIVVPPDKTVVGNTNVATTGATPATNVTGGTLLLDTLFPTNQGPISVQSVNGNALQATGTGTIGIPNPGVTVRTTGIGHAAIANGANTTITIGSGTTITTSGTNASGVRVENGGQVSITGSQVTTSGAGAADTNPNSAVRVISGGTATVNGSTIAGTGIRAHGVSVEGSGSEAFLTNSTISAAGTRANALRLFADGTATVNNSQLTSTNFSAVVLDGAAATAFLTNTTVNAATPVTLIGYGVRATAGSAATLTGGSVSTQGRDSAALSTGSSSITANNVTITTSGPDNAMGVLSDGAGTITLNGGSVTTSGNSVRNGARPHGVAGRNPGGVLIATGTTILTQGAEAFGAVADDGGRVTLNNLSVRTENTSNSGPQSAGAIGLFSVAEQVGVQFPALLTANTVTVETLGARAHGASAQARNDQPVERATIIINDGRVTTHGDRARGLYSVLGNYGSPPTGRGEAVIIANRSTVRTEGAGAHGIHALDNPASVTVNQSSVLATGAAAHGAVAEAGGLIVGNNSTVTATGANSSALFAAGIAAPVSTAIFTGSTLTNSSGATIGVAGVANISLTNSTAGGSGEWLRVGTLPDFPPLGAQDPPLTGINEDLDPDAPIPPTLPGLPPPPGLPIVPGLANVSLTGSTVTGSAFTAVGSVSNVTMSNNSLWNMTGNSNLTNLTNSASLIAYSPPVGGAFKTLTTVNYTGANGFLAINTFLGTDGSPSDLLVIDGGTATGTSKIRVANAGGPGALTVSDGIRVVDAINGATTAPGAFALDGRVVAGAYEYRLFRGGVVDPNDNDWYLRSRQESNPGTPLFRPEVPAYLGNQRAATTMFLHTLHERLGEPQFTEAARDDCNNRVGAVWLRSVGNYIDLDSSNGFPFSTQTTTWLVQGGGEVAQWSFFGEQDRIHVGGMFGFGQSQVKAGATGNPFRATGDLDGYSGGIYATWYENDADRLGLYVDSWILAGWFDNEVQGEGLPRVNYDSRLMTVSPEIGYAFKPQDSLLVFEPQAQFFYSYFNQDNITETNGSQVADSNRNMYTSRLGVRTYGWWSTNGWLNANGNDFQPFLKFNWWHDFQRESVAFNGLRFNYGVPKDRFDVGVGMNARFGKNLAIWGNVEYLFGSNYSGIEGLAGVKYTW